MLTVDELTQRRRASSSTRSARRSQDFAENTLEHIRDERELLAGRLEIPELRTEFRDRHALIVVRGTDYRRDLRALRPTSATCGRCWSASTAAATRCSRRG